MMEVKITEQDLLSHSTCYEVLHEEDYEIQDGIDDSIAFKATNDPDTVCYHEAMRKSDRG